MNIEKAVYSRTRWCRLCGYPIEVWKRWNGLATVYLYKSGREEDMDVDEFITHCPGCGERLYSHELVNRPPS